MAAVTTLASLSASESAPAEASSPNVSSGRGLGSVQDRPEIPRQIRQLWITRFDCFAGLLPHGIQPSDIDQVIERKSHFLFIEFKRPRQTIPTGQAKLFDNLVALSRPPKSTVRLLVITGNPPDQLTAYRWWRTGSGKSGRAIQSDVYGIRDLILRWYLWADKN